MVSCRNQHALFQAKGNYGKTAKGKVNKKKSSFFLTSSQQTLDKLSDFKDSQKVTHKPM